ncbi:CarboxypepD_reg-like domain-containing protein [Marivirga sericea]|uniref:CarboxypepD_reg-like domain-containing protein n=1 Tax=Marivirga sericea TaxID=1028 RepID=A0A1X7JZB7_9BACT|nr:carboxypeptidase-like regulatory domain-containing protein [Marivirga sericea]SMG33920.1 CarboxypepD_reg-like domain-containing protein [Marivirga sericea]
MKTFLLFIFLIFSTFGLHAQSLKGEVTSSEDGLPIDGVHLVNTTANNMAVSDENGRFMLVANKGDTIIASNINFNTKQFVINDEQFLSLTLNPAMIQLDEVRVSNMPDTEAEFRKKIIDMGEVENETFVPFGMTPNKSQGSIPKNYDPDYTKSLAYAINKPVSFIVKKLSKKHKNKVKYYQTVANQGNVIANNKKYNSEIVTELTGLKGDDLVHFMQYLDLDPAFIKRSSEYEIAARILKGYETFKSENQKG